MRVSMYDVPPVFDFIHSIALICVDDELEEEDLRRRMSEALDDLSQAINPVPED